MLGRITAWLAATWLVAGCYEPLGDLCHPSDPECNQTCGSRLCGPAPSDPKLSCGTCPDGQGCTSDGQCSADCESVCADGHCRTAAECCLAQDCGSGDWTCDDDRACTCDNQPCGDGHCPGAGECCGPQDCGTGDWTCGAEHQCSCATTPCPDGYCAAPGGCCADVDDDDACGPDAICDDHACVRGEAGALSIGPAGCTLEGQACPGDLIAFDGQRHVLLDESRCFADVSVEGAVLTGQAVGPGGQGGLLNLCATGTVIVEATGQISMFGRGHGGGGGGGGVQYCSFNSPPVEDSICDFGLGGQGGFADPNGQPGGEARDLNCMIYGPNDVGGGAGGGGGGYGGYPGQNGFGCPPAACVGHPQEMEQAQGGNGGGLYGGLGGRDHGYGNKCGNHDCCNPIPNEPSCENRDPARGASEPAEDGRPGGYAAPECNCDDSLDDTVWIGSGGGGGAGGDRSSGWCCGGADGGAGGVDGGAGHRGCTGGGGGGGGGAGGGAIRIEARRIVVRGSISADGAGHSSLSGGYGAGGGILLSARHAIVMDGGVVRSLGGFGDGLFGDGDNGGTIKMFYRELEGPPPSGNLAGRVYLVDQDP